LEIVGAIVQNEVIIQFDLHFATSGKAVVGNYLNVAAFTLQTDFYHLAPC
jgi:hypothetical protein